MAGRHGIYPKDVIPPRSTYYDSGRFGRMFGKLPPFAADTPNIRHALLDIGKLGGIMDVKDDLTQGPVKLITDLSLSANNSNNPRLSARMTFLGQFLDHDMTFDPTSSLERQADPEQIANFRTPTLALDNLYGTGPGASPHLYDQRAGRGIKFLVEDIGTPGKFDVPRNSQGTAIVGDPRNDENLTVSQLHLVFLKFHNAVVDHVQAELGLTDTGEIFTEAQRIVRWHYQWIILHEFLPLTCGDEIVDDLQPFGLDSRTPLWFYVLREAQDIANGEHLGPVGGRIITEVFLGLLEGGQGVVPGAGPGLEADAADHQCGAAWRGFQGGGSAAVCWGRVKTGEG